MTFIFTLDYELFGNGSGSLMKHVYEPAKEIFEEFRIRNLKFVNFVEAAEFYKISQTGVNTELGLIQNQLKEFYDDGVEIGLHLHPQWFNASRSASGWVLDDSEYHCGRLSYDKLSEYFSISINYLRTILGDPEYSPFSFRAGNWLAQPSNTIAKVMSEYQIVVESSFFKGGRITKHGIDYRKYPKNEPFWTFYKDISLIDPSSELMEIPIYTKMIPFYKALLIRSGVGYKDTNLKVKIEHGVSIQKFENYLDYIRLLYPQKFDFTKMEYKHLIEMAEYCIKSDKRDNNSPIVLIGHSKNLPKASTIGRFLDFLIERNLKVATFREFIGGVC